MSFVKPLGRTNLLRNRELEEFQVCDRDLSDSLLQEYLTVDALAVDTETMGLIYQRDRLCLVQLCDPKNRVTVVRTYSSRHGLKELVLELEQVELDKSAQSSDWGNVANLSDEQLRYAANDVRYLVSVRQKLTHMLQREGRWELAQQCFEALPVMVTLDLLLYRDIFEH
jgi:ribonuclease D